MFYWCVRIFISFTGAFSCVCFHTQHPIFAALNEQEEALRYEPENDISYHAADDAPDGEDDDVNYNGETRVSDSGAAGHPGVMVSLCLVRLSLVNLRVWFYCTVGMEVLYFKCHVTKIFGTTFIPRLFPIHKIK